MEVGGITFKGSGDSVGVAAVWTWPDALDGVTGTDFERAAAVIRRGKWRENGKATAWVGYAIAEGLSRRIHV